MSRDWWYSKRLRALVGKTVVYTLLLAGSFFLLLPLLWTVSTSLKPLSSVFVFPPQWIPNPPVWSNYVEALSRLPFGTFFGNSILVTSLSICGYLLSASLCAYGFARIRFPGRSMLFVVVLMTMMIPWMVLFVPQYILFSKLGWVNTLKPLIIPPFTATGFGGGFFIFLLRQFFLGMPVEIEDAAKIDGCNSFGVYWRMALPASKPVLGIAGTFAFIWTWNDFINPLIYIRSLNRFTVALGLKMFFFGYGTYWHHLMAATVVAMIPCLVLFIVSQRYFMRGIVITGVKG